MKTEFDKKLFLKAQGGDKDAQNEFLSENKGLVYHVVKRFSGRLSDSDDLIQLGMIGLYKALINFDESFNVNFSTYAVPMIAGEIKRFLRDDGMIKVSRSVKELYLRIKYKKSELEISYGRSPKISEIAEALGVKSEEVIYAINASEEISSLDEDVDTGDKKVFLKDKIKDEKTETEEKIVDKLAIAEMLSALKVRERQVIVLRFFKEMTQQEIAKIIGVSQVQVCRIEKKVLKDLKKMCVK